MNPFEQPARQSSIAILFILGRVFRVLLRQFWILILVLLFNPKKKVFTSFTLGLLGLAALGALTSIISYFRTFFYVTNGELVLEKGVLRKSKTAVPLDRIQTVNFKQSLLHQFFNVVSVEIDTAGATGREFSLEAIDKKDAEALRAFITGNKEVQPNTPAMPQKEETNSRLLFQLGIGDLLKIGVSQNHFRTAGIIMIFFLSFIDDLEEALDLHLTERLEQLPGMAQEAEFFHYLLFGVPFFLLLSFLLTLLRTTLQYYSLRFWQTPKGFKMESGLLTRQEVSINLKKVQFVRWDTSPLKRFFKMAEVRLPQATSGKPGRKLTPAFLPGCYEEGLSAILRACFPQGQSTNAPPPAQHNIHWRITIRMFFLQGILPVGALLLLTYSWLTNDVWIWLLWLPFAAWLSYRYYRNWHWYITPESIRTSRGVLNRQNILLLLYKVQAVRISQNFFLRRHGLAHLTLFTAAGAIRVPYIPEHKARAMQDFVLFKVETDTRDWM